MCFDSMNGAKKVFNNEDEFGMIPNKQEKEVDIEVEKLRKRTFSSRNMTFGREDNDLYTNCLR